ncbi:MAG: metallophosphoesterase [Candidatus Aenigmarchaeota archaeon]|nr:metallophosphoesterase [Candidatus Aenigmarchaeota archaeon]
MNVLVVADVHGDFETLSDVLQNVKFDFDVVACPGDFTDIGLSLMGFSREDMLHLILDELVGLGKPVLAVPGNHDPVDTHKILDEYGVNLHGVGRIIDGVGFFGFGGAKTPFDTPFEPTEAETEQGLVRGLSEVSGATKKIMITHNPPKNTKLDTISTGAHVGSQTIRDFILKNKPDASISAHIHEAVGVDVLGTTTLLYPGPSANGWVGLLSVGEKTEAKILNTKR